MWRRHDHQDRVTRPTRGSTCRSAVDVSTHARDLLVRRYDWRDQQTVGKVSGTLPLRFGCLARRPARTRPSRIARFPFLHSVLPSVRRCSLATMSLCLKKGSVPTLCSADELAWLIKTMEEYLPFESKGRVLPLRIEQKQRKKGWTCLIRCRLRSLGSQRHVDSHLPCPDGGTVVGTRITDDRLPSKSEFATAATLGVAGKSCWNQSSPALIL